MIHGIELTGNLSDDLKQLIEESGYRVRIIVQRDDEHTMKDEDEIVIKSLIESYIIDDNADVGAGGYIN